jgi:cell division septation protein DedD
MADDGFREIQLSGKQLAALFMGAVVVLVVTFLCGVLVGRGVRAQKEPAPAGDVVAQSGAAQADPTAVPSMPLGDPSAPPPQPASTSSPKPPEEELSYYSRLEDKPADSAKNAQPATAPPGPAAKPPAQTAPVPPAAAAATTPAKDARTDKAAASPSPAPVSAAPASVSAAPAPGEPAGQGLAIRVAAFKVRAQSDTLAAKLAAKGYTTWVAELPSTGGALFSVRVGKYKTRKDADAALGRLRKEGYKPSLITR